MQLYHFSFGGLLHSLTISTFILPTSEVPGKGCYLYSLSCQHYGIQHSLLPWVHMRTQTQLKKKKNTKQSDTKSCKEKSLVNSYRQKHQNNKFVTSTLKVRKTRKNIFQTLEVNTCQPRKGSFPCPKPAKQTIRPTTTWRSKNISRWSWLSS